MLQKDSIRWVGRSPCTVGTPDMAFIGDSSCLMGFHVSSLQGLLPTQRIESFCSMGYVGPAGYAAIIDKMVARGATPKKLIIAMHPVQFAREKSWNGWVNFVRDDPLAVPVRVDYPKGGLDYLRTSWLERMIYNPLPGTY